MKHIPMGSIGLFTHVIRTVKTEHDFKGFDKDGSPIYLHDSPYPVIRFTGTEKNHGTQASIVFHKDGTKTYQSKERVLSLESDNARFMALMSTKNTDFLIEGIDFKENVSVFGEWCGGSIQKTVALNQLPNLFVVFGIKVDGEWIEKSIENKPESGIYDIRNFKKWEIDIDFNDPQQVQNQLVDWTLEVEDRSPFAIAIGIDETKGSIGEGIVFSTPDKKYIFKVKGELHANGSKVHKLASVDLEIVNSANEFVNLVLTASRLEQGISYLRENNHELSKKSTPIYLDWIKRDIIKEETDTLTKNGLDINTVVSKITAKAREFYFNALNDIWLEKTIN